MTENVQDCADMSSKPRTKRSILEADSPSQEAGTVVKNVASGYRYTDEKGEHLHTLDGTPLIGTSTAVGVLGKEGLVWWGAELAAVTCLESGKHIPTIRAEYNEVGVLTGKEKRAARDKLQQKYPIFKAARYAHREKLYATAEVGTDMHAVLEDYIKTCMRFDDILGYDTENGTRELVIFSEWACANVREFLWSEGHCYSNRLWTGGICDGGARLKSGSIAIIDFKSSADAYYNQHVQAAGYAIQISEHGVFTEDGNLIHDPVSADELIVFPFRSATASPVTVRNANWLRTAFEGAVNAHKGQQRYEALRNER